LQNLIKQQNERLIANYSTDQEKVNRLQIKKKKQKQLRKQYAPILEGQKEQLEQQKEQLVQQIRSTNLLLDQESKPQPQQTLQYTPQRQVLTPEDINKKAQKQEIKYLHREIDKGKMDQKGIDLYYKTKNFIIKYIDSEIDDHQFKLSDKKFDFFAKKIGLATFGTLGIHSPETTGTLKVKFKKCNKLTKIHEYFSEDQDPGKDVALLKLTDQDFNTQWTEIGKYKIIHNKIVELKTASLRGSLDKILTKKKPESFTEPESVVLKEGTGINKKKNKCTKTRIIKNCRIVWI
jgi:hypothetical protein